MSVDAARPAGPAASISIPTDSAEATRALGGRLASLLRAGDVVVLTGGLGAGKTTLAQGVGAAMGVRGRISSPTFVIARVHPATGDGPDLIHVDAYRISSLEELDALDLDSSVADSVTLMEWGEGKAEALSRDRLEITVARPHGGLAAPAVGPGSVTDLEQADDGRRTITVTAVGPRWAGVDLGPLAG
ncbi:MULTISPECIES: tRNA (adenosine(37)-N6)-threonylcarbamoyltransferase complex ATPase subunit type 1 TsaE [unclassified Actinomyces]|uniref:tRNA (adenosine(37)-N6)-threonylcarbamoyltransferase complex ATPase subunit type 1 TsaE n=1 Tax=unclassified Actinomyces TaxID=2609248 RepID=UPI0013743F17|nr:MULTISPECIES: tRNA (adenosine(37)-N6)-threonylcarbamoyltransferase complex ATPase subunit type 1 TsaE [unclassified Actinomyces]MBW3069075.1 tRNA (adenosine(37)-N6)-threonylcarbamoyltransferase complex ATPase subunit type 1 TsaE [Actinomyces sp. 594]NDR54227.1 tRNA (adenosine(37)-N6)-threonylcarbamoyltransferase complex ATPase subunit type 1 TsaE [Actinomyces sp. 565]QHO91601.1 tRNA (adenosine(37)-N6)-threonylcarbamoyltransferase complex ATPase subunit type 1 TsaE [Actinomyces sp. 432]